jgi:rubrerythrin
MTETDETTAKRLQCASDDAHIDALLHPDPCGTGLVRLLQAVDQHRLEERASVEAYERLARAAPDSVVASVMRLLAEDEEHHHRLFEQISRSLQKRLHWSEDMPTPAVEGGTEQWRAEWLDLVRTCEEDERGGALSLRDLAHRAHQEREPLASELFEAMALDSEKHARLLKFVSQRLQRLQV